MGTERLNTESKTPAKRRYTGVIIAAVVLILIALIVLPSKTRMTGPHTNEGIAEAGLRRLLNPLYQYAKMHDGYYPLEMDQNDFIPFIAEYKLYNQFTKANMRSIGFKESPFAGEYTYIPYVKNGKACGFYLFTYGDENYAGEDVDKDGIPDHVLWVLGSDGSSIPTPWPVHELDLPNQCPLPPLDELLKAQKENPQAQSVVSPEDIK